MAFRQLISLNWYPSTVAALAATVVLATVAPKTLAQAVLQITGIDGDFVQQGYVGGIVVDAISVGGIRSDPFGGGTALETLLPVSITKSTDLSSSDLAAAAVGGSLPDWKLTIFVASQPRLTLELCDVYVSSFATVASGSELSLEVFEFTYGGYRMGVPGAGPGDPFVYTQYELAQGATCLVPNSPPDTDGDGLSDAQEAALGTNPNHVDTDGDGLVDGSGGIVTVASYPAGVDANGDGFVDGEADFATNPNVADTDADGIPDGVEVSAGSNPLDPASPGLAGDLTGDGVVDVSDLLVAQKILLGELALTPGYLDRGDVAPLVGGELSRDGVFDLGDLLIIHSIVLNP